MDLPSPPSSTTKEAWKAYTTRIIGGLSLLVFGLGTVVYRLLEDWSWVDSLPPWRPPTGATGPQLVDGR